MAQEQKIESGDTAQKPGAGHFSTVSETHYSFCSLHLLPWCLGISALDSHNELFL